MEKGQGPPYGAPAPPYPGLSTDNNAGFYQPQPTIQTMPQPAYQYSAQQPQVVHPVNQVVVMQQLPADVPGQMLCPYCQYTVVTEISYKTGYYTWHVCAMLTVFLCWPCCCIPFCVKSCKDVEHSCPYCHKVLHIHKKM
ncbi:LITAF domain-containing protein-like [Anoplopoma fimbria]|uniref:LITAF domain-containing protein-like n=1 Tax=Anoplopoma fimbria TaxID=229290 RepID=UPI0023EAB6CA|nr:LITAF domain-containing protein-like [Anoplopoma fimbria]